MQGFKRKRIEKTLSKIFFDGKAMILACDHGFEHGPKDFNIQNINPDYVFNIALEGRFDAIAVQAGIAEKHYHDKFRKIPLIVKLNAKTRFDKKDPVSRQHTSVAYAKKIGAAGVVYTIYLGSINEQEMFVEFGKICEEAHELGLFTMCWMYPRGSSIEHEFDTDIISYGARIAMELGADIVKVKNNGDVQGMNWVVSSVGKTRVVVAGGSKHDSVSFINEITKVLQAGVVGLAVGRNVWQDDKPLDVANELYNIIHPPIINNVPKK